MTGEMVSIIVPVFNSEHYLNKCIDSVLKQDFHHFELILVDDGSADSSGKMIDDWAAKDSRIKTIHQKNGGQSSARNKGLDLAGGDYITFVDSDDYISPDYLSYLLSLMTPDSQLTMCNHTIARGEKQKLNSQSSGRVLTREEAFEEVLFHGCVDVSPWAKLYKKELFENIRFPEGRIYEDTWLFGEIVNKCDSIVFGERSCYTYVIHSQSTVRKEYSSLNLQYIEAAEKLAKDALRCDPSLYTGGVRRINHSRISVLRYMEHSQEKETKEMLRKKVLEDYYIYQHHPRTPQRDKMAVFLLRIGFFPFYFCWNLYNALR